MRVNSSASSSSRHMKKITSFYKSKIVIFSFKTLFRTFHPLTSKMKNAVLPYVYTSVCLASSIQLYFVKNHDNYKVAPELAVSEISLSELQIKAFVFLI